MSDEWEKRIAIAYLVKQRLAEVDREGRWPHDLPRVRADEIELARVDSLLGERLDNDYRAFLLCADGWPGFLQDIDLFGTAELKGSPMRTKAEDFLRAAGASSTELLPIGASRNGSGVFAIRRASSKRPGAVTWYDAQAEIDTFPDFEEFFLAMIDYNRREVRELE